jgi:DnaK suppressor protein
MHNESNSSKVITNYDPLLDVNYMSPQMIEYFKHKLEELRHRILEKEENISSDIARVDNNNTDVADQGATEDLHYVDISLHEHEEYLRQEIENALQRVKDGTYGYCLTTGEPIGVKRLLLVPTARYSIKIQQILERDHKW